MAVEFNTSMELIKQSHSKIAAKLNKTQYVPSNEVDYLGCAEELLRGRLTGAADQSGRNNLNLSKTP